MDIRNMNDQPITLIQQPFLQSGTRHYRLARRNATDSWYQADGTDAEGVKYRIYWEISNHESEDESEACDWDDFTITEL